MKKDDFFNDLGIKIVALILSLLIWFHATTEKTYIQTVELPVIYSFKVPDSLILVTTPPKKVRVRVSGKGKSLLKLKYTKTYYFVDAGELSVGKNILDMTQGNIPGMEDIKVLEVIPQKVLFLVDRYSTKIIYSIRPIYLYDTTNTHVYTKKITPHTARVRGPRTTLRMLRYLTTDTIYLDSLRTGNYTKNVSLHSPFKLVQILKPRNVKVSFSLIRFLFDTISVESDSIRYKLILKYPDTLRINPDSISCKPDTFDNSLNCLFPEGVVLLNFLRE